VLLLLLEAKTLENNRPEPNTRDETDDNESMMVCVKDCSTPGRKKRSNIWQRKLLTYTISKIPHDCDAETYIMTHLHASTLDGAGDGVGYTSKRCQWREGVAEVKESTVGSLLSSSEYFVVYL